MVTAPHTPVPFSPALEDLYIPSAASDRGGGAQVVEPKHRAM